MEDALEGTELHQDIEAAFPMPEGTDGDIPVDPQNTETELEIDPFPESPGFLTPRVGPDIGFLEPGFETDETFGPDFMFP